MKSILLGLLAAATIPVNLIDAVSNSNAKVALSRQEDNLNSDSLKVYSDFWLKDITKILLSGSMFQKCRAKSVQKKYSELEVFPTAIQEFKNLGCIFPWQNSLKKEDQDRGLSTTFGSTNAVSASNLTQPEVLTQTPIKFPKLSRSSLIVSLPQTDSTFVPPSTKLANPVPKTKRIASPFGWRRRPYSYQLQFHQGVDYGAPLGSPVVAVGDGIVTRVVSGCYDFGSLFCGGQLGNWIEIDHGNGAIGTYGHLKNSSITIKEGMKVWKNQEIAQVGSSGWSTGAHLDFRLKINGEYENPAQHLIQPTFSDL